MKKILYFPLLAVISLIVFPLAASANGGMWHWPPDIYVSQTDQNAIIGWNGSEEMLVLSTNWAKPADSGEVTLLKAVPLPANPTEIKEGDSAIFDKLVVLLNEKINNLRAQNSGAAGSALSDSKEAGAPAVEIMLQKMIGAHDVTVVKVNNPDEFSNWIDGFAAGKKLEKKQVSDEFKNGLKSYLKRGINYFVFDVAVLGDEKTTIKPLVYRFPTNYFYFPMLVSGVSEIADSQTSVNLFLIYPDTVKLPQSIWPSGGDYWVSDDHLELSLTNKELRGVSEPLASMFAGDVSSRTFRMNGLLSKINKDLMLFPQLLTSNLKIGMANNDVKILQQLLINEGFWQSDADVTGYFGPATKSAVMKFQEKNKAEILTPLGLSAPTGFFGPYTRKYLNENIFVGTK